MKNQRDGGSAFPCGEAACHAAAVAAIEGIPRENTGERDRLYLAVRAQRSAGMSVLDYVAAKMMQTYRHVTMIDSNARASLFDEARRNGCDYVDQMAEWAFTDAEAFLRARERRS